MPLPDDWEATFANNKLQSARMRCPHCDIATTAHVEFTAQQQDYQKMMHYATLRCDYAKCRKLVFVVTTVTPGAGRQDHTDSLTIYPNRSIAPPHESLPAPVAEDWIEAQKAFHQGATKAAAVMCRRVLYGVLLNLGCKEHPLHESVGELVAKVQPPNIVKEWLIEIKEDGHDAAHPFRALDVPSQNVAETMEYTKELLRFAYIEPFELDKRLARKAASTAPSAP
jgi:hypothetical protein